MWRKIIASVLLLNAIGWQSCEYEVVPAVVDCDEDPVTLTLVSAHNSNCALPDGRLEVLASGGSGSYKYILGDGEPQTSAVFEGLGAGLYEITAIDKNNCSSTIEATVINSNGVNISFVTTDAGGCNAAQGSLTVEAFDGTEPYQYKLDGGAVSSDPVFSGLSRGDHTLTVTDASGCQVIQTVKVRSGISFAASIAPIIEDNCTISGCHNGSQFPDLRVFKNIHDNAGRIKAVTGDRSMPQGRSLTQTEINMIACWVDDGALNN